MMIHSSSLEVPTWKLTSGSAAVVLNRACSTMVKNFVFVSLFSRLHRVLFANRKLELPKKESMMLTKKIGLDHSEQPGNCWESRTSLLNMALQFYMTFFPLLLLIWQFHVVSLIARSCLTFSFAMETKNRLIGSAMARHTASPKKHQIYTAQQTRVTIRWKIIFDTEPNPPGQPTH